MIVVLSPAKSLDFNTPAGTSAHSQPEFAADAALLVEQLRAMPSAQLAQLMSISESLAALNSARFASWKPSASGKNAKQALLAFDGGVYAGLAASTLNDPQLKFAQRHLRILSGLYGLLRPLDLIQPYRLEMGTRLATQRGGDLYRFWGDRLTARLNDAIVSTGGCALVNLASEEYFRAVQPARLAAPVVSPAFEDWQAGRFKIVSFWAKRARGMMARWIVEHAVTDPRALRDFAVEGYRFDAGASTDARPVFRRMH